MNESCLYEQIYDMNIEQTRACLGNDFCKMCVTVYGKFVLDEGVVASYDNRIRDEGSTKCGMQITGMISRHSLSLIYSQDYYPTHSYGLR